MSEKADTLFAKRLAKLRKERQMSQQQLALMLGCSRGQIGNYELGSREPDILTLVKIADFFQVTLDYLIGKTEIRTSKVKESVEKLVSIAEELNEESIDYLTQDAHLLKIKEKMVDAKESQSSTLTGSS